jgi:integrase
MASPAKVKLTKTAVEKLTAADGKRAIYWDSVIIGFGIRVMPSGSKTFFYQGRVNKELIRVTIGKFPAKNAEQARKEAKRIQGQIADGQDPRPEKEEAGAATFGDLMTAYGDVLEAQGKLSAKAVKNQITRDIKDAFPKLWAKPAASIDLDDCMKIVGRLKDADKPRQADKIRSYIKTAFSEAIAARGNVNMPAAMRRMTITSNPAREMRKVEGSSKPRSRALSIAEFRAYWRRVKLLPEPHRSLAMLHVLTGGQRQQQLARVTLEDLDRDAMAMTVMDYKGRRKQPRVHVIPLLPEALECIDRITGGGPYVFSHNGGESPIYADFLNEIAGKIRADMEAAGELENGHFTAGTIRATIETRLMGKPYRVSSDVLAQLLSHGTGSIQRRHYVHDDFEEEKLEALEKLHRMVEGRDEPSAQVIEMRARA